jgi:peroxiredoxin
MVELGTKMPRFALPDTRGEVVASDDLAQEGLLVAFLCSHCEYTVHVRSAFAQLAKAYAPRGLGVIGINANDDTYPEDGPDRMKAETEAAGYDFPYLYDASQQVAAAFGASCTPDFFLYDADRRLFYRGQFDDSRPKSGVATGADLRAALDALLGGGEPPSKQKSSVGCNIKWRPENAPEYFDGGMLYWWLRRLQRW